MSIKKIYRQDKGSQGMALVSQVGMQLPRELQKRHERKERKIKRKKDRTVEKRLLGDRKYRCVCTPDSRIHNSHFASFSAVRSFAVREIQK